jgi:RES domain-containing protein
MRAWRIASSRHALDRLGTGAAIKGGRWNSANVHAIYAGLTPEIAALEKLVHTGSILPSNLVFVRIELPDDEDLYERPGLGDLPQGWSGTPAPPAAADYGDAFLVQGERLGLIVPSVVVPEAANIVINPRHPGMAEVTLEVIREFTFDRRLRP